MRWPTGFWWGTGASSTQCEGAAPSSDWWAWERDGHAPRSGHGMGVAGGRVVIHPADAPVSPLGYGIWADGVGVVLDRLHAEVPGTPLLVAEYGIGTDDDEQRARYLARGLEVVHAAIGRGVDVRGLFHWTGVDNYEWLHGDEVAFGIIDRDRRVRPSALVLQREATA
jgi:beta-glucosidase